MKVFAFLICTFFLHYCVASNGLLNQQILATQCLVDDVSSCVAQCDEAGSGNTIEFCGTDYQTHSMFTNQYNCYYYTCNVSAIYPATCGCPNYCNSDFSHGWTGEDCSQVSCPNSCSSHGTCSNDVCECDQHHTSADCITAQNSLNKLPYGEIYSGKYWHDDEYKDDHPIFNLSVIASIRISISQEDLNSMLYPPNAFSQDWFSSTFQFDNGNVQDTIDNVGIKLRGAATRTKLKKGFSLSFSTFQSGRKFYHMKHLNMKYAYGDDSVMRNQLVAEFYRASMIPVQRGSFATLWINNIFWGVYWLCEDLDDVFLKSRFKDGSGNFYKGASGAYMTYLGDDPNLYKNLTYNKYGATQNYYSQVEGKDESWTDLANFFAVLNKTSNYDFEDTTDEIFDVHMYLQGLVVETMIRNTDGYTDHGNNWALYNDPDSGKWKYIFFDFDNTFGDDFQQSIFSFDCTPDCVLTDRIMQVHKFRTKYQEYFSKFASQVWNPYKTCFK